MDAANFQPLVELIQWERSGGEVRAGLPTTTADTLVNECLLLRSHLRMARGDLDRAVQIWGMIDSEPRTAASLLGKVAAELGEAQAAFESAEQAGGTVFASATSLRATLEHYVKQDTKQISQAQVDSVTALALAITYDAQAKVARSELDGAKGFLNGFVTGITFTLHNPVEQNLRLAREGAAKARAEQARHLLMIDRAKALQAERKSAMGAIARVDRVSEGVTKLKNAAANARTSIAAAQLKLKAGKAIAGSPAAAIVLKAARRNFDTLAAMRPALATL